MINIASGIFILFFLLMSLGEWIEILKTSPFISFVVTLIVIGVIMSSKVGEAIKEAVSYGWKVFLVAVVVITILGIIGYFMDKDKED